MYLFQTFLVNIIGNNQVNLIRSATFSCLVCVFHLFVKSTWMNMFRYIFDAIVSFEWSFCSTPKFHLVRYLFHLLYLFCTFLSSQLEMFFSVNKLSRNGLLRYLFSILCTSCMFLSNKLEFICSATFSNLMHIFVQNCPCFCCKNHNARTLSDLRCFCCNLYLAKSFCQPAV